MKPLARSHMVLHASPETLYLLAKMAHAHRKRISSKNDVAVKVSPEATLAVLVKDAAKVQGVTGKPPSAERVHQRMHELVKKLEERGMLRSDIALAIGCAPSSLSRLLDDKTRVSYANLVRACGVLEAMVDES